MVRSYLITVVGILLAYGQPSNAQWVQWTVEEGGNGHWYGLTELATWPGAEAQAQLFSGYLVAINDANENAWVLANIATCENVWIGLYQDEDDAAFSEPDGGWNWSNGDPLGYVNWLVGEPNDNLGSEDWAEMKGGCAAHPPGGWNDQQPDRELRGVVELVALPPSVPATSTWTFLIWLLAVPAIATVVFRKRRAAA